MGANVFERTSRQVRLTPLGQELYDQLAPVYARLVAIMNDTRSKAATTRVQLRLGYHSVNAVGPALTDRTAAFEAAHPDCAISHLELPFADPFTPLRRGTVDLLLTYRPQQALPDLALGVLTRTVVDVSETSGVEWELSRTLARGLGGLWCHTVTRG